MLTRYLSCFLLIMMLCANAFAEEPPVPLIAINDQEQEGIPKETYQIDVLVFSPHHRDTSPEITSPQLLTANEAELVDYWTLPTSQSTLDEVATKLTASGKYVVIDQFSWQQPLPAWKKQQPIYLYDDMGIAAIIKLYRGKYLNFTVDLNYVDRSTHYLTAKRRLKPDQLHYIDHPKLGMIVKISKVEKVTKQEEKTASPTLAG